MSNLRLPGPSRLDLLMNARRIRGNVLGSLQEWHKQYGDIVELPLKRRTFLLYSPSDIRHVLVTNQRNYHKTGGILIGKRIFGQGLLASEGDFHRTQRRIMQPMFHQNSIAGYGAIMSETITETIKNWEDGSVVDIAAEMSQTTLAIVGRSLFSLDLNKDAHELHRSLVAVQHYITRRQQAILPLPEFFPTPTSVRYRQAARSFDRILYRMIAARRAQKDQPHDVLSLLLQARYDDGSSMPDNQIRDELLILLLAGHETTSNALTWAVYLLGQHPHVASKLREELRHTLDGRTPQTGDVPHLVYTASVMNEAMRLLPPVWIMGRRSLNEDTLPGGVRIPGQANIAMPQYVVHRDPEYFPEPDRFLPERFLSRKDITPCSFIPFGGGARSCIGEGFARMEATLLLATIMQQVTLELVPDQKIIPNPLITLGPKHGLFVRIRQHRNAIESMSTEHRSFSPHQRIA